MYKFHNQNPLNLYTDDCTIRAISMAEDSTWDYTYNKLSDLAQEYGTLMNDRNFIIDYLSKRYKRLSDKDIRVGELSAKYPNNVLLITMPGHITVSKFGTIYDLFDCRDSIIEYAFLVK